ncbi:hypothetical protein P280DRAFT_79837 [Massarina eburnea CBS 473.64]|uniref:Uncharacterized protein n=1 Tax=Massarina eburnea CBS 473.64 TaxID=1395130 RepID=A0A6A6RSD5_9PLEO|nr:hypothetical protein P280DRAFT_79837 [Massarina eburnea CBS 473.64]
MAALFGHFSFEAASRRPVCDARHQETACDDALDEIVSPTSVTTLAPSPARLPTPPPCSIGDLAHALGRQSLRITVDTSYRFHDEPLTPPSDDVSFPTNKPEREALTPSPTLSVSRLNSATLRMQRQTNVRMQCSASHVNDITKLVKMIEEGDQCNVCEVKATTLQSPPAPEEDEGIDMDYTPTAKEQLHTYIPHYRAGERDTGARVVKRTRMRRPRAVSKQ